MSEKTQHEQLTDAFKKAMNAAHSHQTWEAERVRLRLEAAKSAQAEAEQAAALAAVRAEQAEAHAATQALPGIVLQPSPPTFYQDPIDGTMVPFAGSTEPPSRGMLPPPPPPKDLPVEDTF